MTRSARRPCRRASIAAPHRRGRVVEVAWSSPGVGRCRIAAGRRWRRIRRCRSRRSEHAVVDGDLLAAQVAVGDLVVVQDAQRFPHARNGNRLDAFVSGVPRAGVCAYKRPAAVEGGDAIVEVLATRELTDGDRHQRAMLDGAAHRGRAGVRSRCRAAAPCARAGAAPRRCVGGGRTVRRSRPRSLLLAVRPQHERAGAGGPHDREARHHESAPGHRPDRAVQRHLETRGCRRRGPPTRRRTSPTARPSSDAGRHHGADDEVDRHEGQQQRPPPASPPGGQPWARDREHRGEHRDPARVVDELGRAACRAARTGRSAICGAAMPLPVTDSARTAISRGRRVRAEQLPLAADDQADQDHERQRQNRDAVDQVHQVGLGRRAGPPTISETDFSSAIPLARG